MAHRLADLSSTICSADDGAPSGGGGGGSAPAPSPDNITGVFAGSGQLAHYEEIQPQGQQQAQPQEQSAAQQAQPPQEQGAPQEQEASAPGEQPQQQAAPQTPPLAQQRPQMDPVVRQLMMAQRAADQRVASLVQQMEQSQAREQAYMQQASDARRASQMETQRLARAEQRRAEIPARPDPTISTAQQMFDWGQQYADVKARHAMEDSEDRFTQRLSGVEQTLKQTTERMQKAELEKSAQHNDRLLDASISQIANDPRYPFMKAPDLQTGFLAHWWSMNQTTGRIVAPQQAFQSFVGMLQAATRSMQVTQPRIAAQTVDQQKRAEQQRRGAPPTLGQRGNNSPDGGQRNNVNQKVQELQKIYDTPWQFTNMH